MSALPDDLLELLRCPETGGPLRHADDALKSKLQTLLREKRLVDRKGSNVRGKIDAVLVREDDAVAYLVQDGIVDLAAHAGIALTFGTV